MALALAGYFGTMMAAFVVLMTLLNGVLSSYPMEKARSQPRPSPHIAAALPDASAEPNGRSSRDDPPINHSHRLADGTANATTAADVQSAPAKAKAIGTAKPLKQARDPKLREELAHGPKDPSHATALANDQERSRQPLGPLAANPFNLFETPR